MIRPIARTVGRWLYPFTAGVLVVRDELPVLLNRRGLLGSGAEIGVHRGMFSAHILRVWRGERLISVDPWLEADDYEDRCNVSQDRQEDLYEETVAHLAEYGDRSAVWRMTSLHASELVADESLDFVYLDARHDFDSVTEDLEAWYCKIRPGGILAGHDYLDGRLPEGVFGVRSAVDGFFTRLNVAVSPTLEAEWRSWVVVKPARGGLAPHVWNVGWDAIARVFRWSVRQKRRLAELVTRHGGPASETPGPDSP